MDPIQIDRQGKAWAIKHKDSFLGAAQTHAEATKLACELAASLTNQRHPKSAVAVAPRAWPSP